MIVNVRLELDDVQRNRISRLINPRAAKRLASRQDITEFVRSCVEHAAGAVHIGTPTTESIRAEARPPDEQLLIDSLRREGMRQLHPRRPAGSPGSARPMIDTTVAWTIQHHAVGSAIVFLCAQRPNPAPVAVSRTARSKSPETNGALPGPQQRILNAISWFEALLLMFEDDTTEAHERRIVRCRSCRAKIIWFTTAAGKKMPVDADTVEPDDDDDELDLERHVSHFATCPDAARFRRGR